MVALHPLHTSGGPGAGPSAQALPFWSLNSCQKLHEVARSNLTSCNAAGCPWGMRCPALHRAPRSSQARAAAAASLARHSPLSPRHSPLSPDPLYRHRAAGFTSSHSFSSLNSLGGVAASSCLEACSPPPQHAAAQPRLTSWITAPSRRPRLVGWKRRRRFSAAADSAPPPPPPPLAIHCGAFRPDQPHSSPLKLQADGKAGWARPMGRGTWSAAAAPDSSASCVPALACLPRHAPARPAAPTPTPCASPTAGADPGELHRRATLLRLHFHPVHRLAL